MLRSMLVRQVACALVILAVGFHPGCKPGGSYRGSERAGGEVDRGETNGRMFDFVSNLPDGDDWQIRIRDDSMWAAYANGSDEKELGTVSLDQKESRKVWKLIDEIDLGGRDKGKKNEDDGYVMLRLREPGGEEGHDLITVFVSRATKDEAVLDLGAYLQTLIKKHFKKDIQF
jgi:hypothetical protein